MSDMYLVPQTSDVSDALDQLAADIGDREIIASIATSFLDDLPSSVQSMLDASDGPGRSFAAHRLKSSSRAMGASALSGVCARLEADPDDTEAAEALPAIADESARLVRRWIAG